MLHEEFGQSSNCPCFAASRRAFDEGHRGLSYSLNGLVLAVVEVLLILEEDWLYFLYYCHTTISNEVSDGGVDFPALPEKVFVVFVLDGVDLATDCWVFGGNHVVAVIHKLLIIRVENRGFARMLVEAYRIARKRSDPL